MILPRFAFPLNLIPVLLRNIGNLIRVLLVALVPTDPATDYPLVYPVVKCNMSRLWGNKYAAAPDLARHCLLTSTQEQSFPCA
uniref:Uncharacterized protein n=1 Tax=Oryza nivara TaxID=4536 RepID=A0A0E0G311_ORYNI